MTAPYTATPAVMAFKDLSLHGNVIPMAWYRQLTLANGKPNLPAIIILSDIVYWYRPVEVRDETTGHIIGYRAKFRADQLQRSYEQFADQFGLTKRQAKDAINYLLERGLITREFRSVAGSDGRLIGNVMFVAPIPPAILRINQLGNQHGETRIEQADSVSPPCDDTAPEGLPSAIPSDDPPIQGDRSIDPPMTIERQTYTESTTETSSSITPSPPSAAGAADGEATAVADGGDGAVSPLADWLKREMGIVTAERFSAYPDAATRAYVQRLRDGGANAAMIAADLAKPATRRMLESTPPAPAPDPPPLPPESDSRRPGWIAPEQWQSLTDPQRDALALAQLVDGRVEARYPDLTESIYKRWSPTIQRLIQATGERV